MAVQLIQQEHTNITPGSSQDESPADWARYSFELTHLVDFTTVLL
jgi:hypothetical protein